MKVVHTALPPSMVRTSRSMVRDYTSTTQFSPRARFKEQMSSRYLWDCLCWLFPFYSIDAARCVGDSYSPVYWLTIFIMPLRLDSSLPTTTCTSFIWHCSQSVSLPSFLL